jgi:hypothetical protein
MSMALAARVSTLVLANPTYGSRSVALCASILDGSWPIR